MIDPCKSFLSAYHLRTSSQALIFNDTLMEKLILYAYTKKKWVSPLLLTLDLIALSSVLPVFDSNLNF